MRTDNQMFDFPGDPIPIDGAHDKMMSRINDPEFPIRLLPPYSHASEEQFRQFEAELRRRLRQWLPATAE